MTESAKTWLQDPWGRLRQCFSKQSPELVKAKSNRHLSATKRARLELLCEKLLAHTELLNSGKLQLLGLVEIKKRLGKRWEGLSKIVYETVESVLKELTGPNDLYIRYRDYTYIIVFAKASLEEAEVTTSMIASTIRQRLFELDEDQLRQIEVDSAIGVMRTDKIIEYGFADFLDMYMSDSDQLPDLMVFEDIEPEPEPEAKLVKVSAKDYRPENELQAAPVTLEIETLYKPLWDVKRNALTTYLCEAFDKTSGEIIFNAYNEVKDQGLSHQLSLDIEILEKSTLELKAMESDGRKALVTCPVQYQTLHVFEGYERYKEKLEEIPPNLRQLLVFHVVDTMESMPEKNVYWFARPLRQFCRHIFAEVPLRTDTNPAFLKNTGVDFVGVRIHDPSLPESEIFRRMSSFGPRAKMFKIPYTFMLGVDRISLATSAVCVGFDIIGGSAIHEPVKRPDVVHKFTHGDLIKSLLPTSASV